MDLYEILLKAAQNTCLGMGTVFLMLIFMSFIIYLLRFVPDIKKNELSAISPSTIIEKDLSEDDQQTAVIFAALQAFEFEEEETNENTLNDTKTIFTAKRIIKR